MDIPEQLYGLMAISEEHQKTVQRVIDELTIERDALRRERLSLDEQRAALVEVTQKAVCAIQKVRSDAAVTVVAKSRDAAAKAVMNSFEKAAEPMMGRLTVMANTAESAEAQLFAASRWFSLRLGLWTILATGGVLVAMWMTSMAYIEWQRHKIEGLVQRRLELQIEVSGLEVNAMKWSRVGGRAKLQTCGDDRRLCVRVDTSQPYSDARDMFILKGY